MKLYCNRPSPYGRKVLVVMHEKALAGRVEIIDVDPWSDQAQFHAVTPVGKIPALVTDDGQLLVESATIAEYFDSIDTDSSLIGATRFSVLGRASLAHGLIDAAFATVIERRRPKEHQWAPWLARQRAAIERTLRRFAPPPAGRFDLGDISLACGLAYLDFRLPEIAWRLQHENLAAWLDDVNQRPSMRASQPQ